MGIGTTSPQNKLHVVGDTTIDGNVFVQNGDMRLPDNHALIIGNGVFLAAGQTTYMRGNSIVITDQSGNALKLAIDQQNNATLPGDLNIQQSQTSEFLRLSSTQQPLEYLSIAGVAEPGSGTGFAFHNQDYNGSGYTATTPLYLSASGKVGIGTTNPQGKFDVAGAVAINGTTIINASGQWVGSPTGLVGPQGPQGIQGPVGATGPQGPQGNQGIQGIQGVAGTDGKTVRSGSGVPSSGLGVNGDFYIDTIADAIYGPKASGSWGSATSLIGPQGPQGPAGSPGVNTYCIGTDGFGPPGGQVDAQAACATQCGGVSYRNGWSAGNCNISSTFGPCTASNASGQLGTSQGLCCECRAH